MLTKKTSKNQVTIPKKILEQIPASDYFDVRVQEDEIILSPVSVTSKSTTLRAIRQKMKKLGMTTKDVEAAVRWARSK